MDALPASDLLRQYLIQLRDFGITEMILEKSPQKTGDDSLLNALFASTKNCLQCGLGKGRIHFVFGSGNFSAKLMFIGEAPGEEEDLHGLPFVGAAGGLLTKMIEAMGLAREQVYIANILKCRPPNNRDPAEDEITSCFSILERQIQIINPAFICALGRIAAHTLLGTALPLGRLRGQFHNYKGRKLIVTYHPSALLRNAEWKRPAWEDLQLLMHEMGLEKS